VCVCVYNFLLVGGLFFIVLRVTFKEQKLLIFKRFIFLQYFLSWLGIFLCPKNLCLPQGFTCKFVIHFGLAFVYGVR
jgi:hypothetical protein